MTLPAEPADRFVDSHGLRLHYADWGNAAAPPLLLIHGGRDHGRSWDRVARALQPHFHVMAPDLRGHGDSDWATGSSYSLADNIYDLTHLAGAGQKTVLVGHSFGGMIAMAFAGTFPERVARLAVLDGAFLPNASSGIDVQMTQWIAQIDKVSASQPRRFATVAEAAARMVQHNTRLTPEWALHLATHAVKRDADGTYRWKYDPYQTVRAPYRLSREDYIALWSRIACPTLLLCAGDSFILDAAQAGLLQHVPHAQHAIVDGAGHWLHHDKPDETIAMLRGFLGVVA